MPRYGIQLNRKTLVKWSRHRWKRQGRMVARWYALVPEPVKRIVRIITDAVTFAPSPSPPPWSIFLSGLSVSSDTGFYRGGSRLLYACTRRTYAPMTIDTRHTFTLGVQFDHDLETIVPFFRYDLQRHRCVVDSPRCFKTREGAGKGTERRWLTDILTWS